MLRLRIICFLASCLFLPGSLDGQRPSARGIQRWTVEEAPSVVIGETTGKPEYVFAALRSALQLSDRRIVTMDAIRDFAEMRYYGPDGRFLESAGRWGQGPSEFQYPIGLFRLSGDSLFVLSTDLRFSIFGPGGDAVTSGRLELKETVVPSRALLMSRSQLAVQVAVPNPGLPETGVTRYAAHYVIWDLVGKKETRIPAIPGARTYFERQGGGVLVYPSPFSPSDLVASSGGLLWVAQSDVPIIRGYDAQGTMRTEIRLPFRAQRVGADDRDRYRSMLKERSERLAQYAGRVTFPEEFPVLANLKTDSHGDLWVQEYQKPWDTGDQRWDVLDQAGRLIAEVRLPERVVGHCTELDSRGCDRILDIGADYILIHRIDDLGVSRIAIHRLTTAGR